jgi:Lrp/AsnC family transcriptional regulator, leucine-responsive regulatory protein
LELDLPAKQRQSRQNSYDPQSQILDEVNLRLLAELRASPRLSMAELARRTGMSAPAVTERVQRLERAGVIAGYRLDIDPASVGLPVTAFARIRPMPGSLPKIAELAASIPQVTECYRITGEDCFLIKLHAPAIEQLEAVLDRFLAYGNTTTSLVVSTPVPRRPPPLPDPPAAR